MANPYLHVAVRLSFDPANGVVSDENESVLNMKLINWAGMYSDIKKN